MYFLFLFKFFVVVDMVYNERVERVVYGLHVVFILIVSKFYLLSYSK